MHHSQKWSSLLLLFEIYKQYIKIICLCKTKNKTLRTREILEKNSRDLYRFFSKTLVVIKEKDLKQFYKAVRMGVPLFNLLISLTSKRLTKHSRREPVHPECRLSITLIFLAHGAPLQVLSWAFKICVTSVREIIYETCDIIWEELSKIYLASPNESEFKSIAEEFYGLSKMPHCIGAIDGKQINIKRPPNVESEYYNYKGHYSIVLWAACDAKMCFTFVDIGAYGSQSDDGLFSNSSFGRKIIEGDLPIPKSDPLPMSNEKFPYFFVANSTFPLRCHLMRPYPGRRLSPEKANFNTRLSNARRLTENAFGVLATRWRILLNTINCRPKKADTLVKATAVLHNFCKLNDPLYSPPEYVDSFVNNEVVEGLWRQDGHKLQSVREICGYNAPRNAFRLRDKLKEYLVNY